MIFFKTPPNKPCKSLFLFCFLHEEATIYRPILHSYDTICFEVLSSYTCSNRIEPCRFVCFLLCPCRCFRVQRRCDVDDVDTVGRTADPTSLSDDTTTVEFLDTEHNFVGLVTHRSTTFDAYIFEVDEATFAKPWRILPFYSLIHQIDDAPTFFMYRPHLSSSHVHCLKFFWR